MVPPDRRRMQTLMSLDKTVRRGGYAALALTTAILAACGSTPALDDPNATAEKLYADAKEEMENGSYSNAIKSMERVEGRASGTVLAQQSQLELAWLYWKTNEKAQALSTLDRFLKLHPSSPAYDYALYLRGLVNFNDDFGVLGGISGQDLSERDQQASREAFESFKQLVDQYPTSKYAADARLRMDYIVNSLAEYEVHVAKYYLRRGANLAAANRAKLAVTDYPNTPAVEEGLYVMMEAYDRLGLTQLRDDAERVFKLNYPNSELLAGGFRLKPKPWWQLW